MSRGSLLMHLARIISMHQGLAIPTTVLLMHQDLEEATRETISTVLPGLTQSQLEDVSIVGKKGTSLVSVLPRMLLQLVPMQPR